MKSMPGYIGGLLLVLVLAAGCMHTPPSQGPDTGSAVITYRSYGGFITPSYAVQELVVTRQNATLTVFSREGNVTEQFRKTLTKDQFDALVNVFADNNFGAFGDRYVEGQNHVTDVGFTDITFRAGNLTKTVTTYNVNDYLPEGLIRIREKLQETAAFTRTPDEGQLRQIAETWIVRAPTYAYDGAGLTFVNDTRQGSAPARDELTYRFASGHAGYGNRSGTVTTPAVTGHTIQVTIEDRSVTSAVIDGRWDETGQFLIGSVIPLSYQPRQCEKTTWRVWEANSGRVYIRMPTDEEIIKNYYNSVYGIEVGNVTRVDSGLMSCDACSVCPETYHFGLTVNASGMQPLLDEGWTRNG